MPRVTVYLFCSESTGVGQGVGVGTARTGARQPAITDASKGSSSRMLCNLRERALGLCDGEAVISEKWIVVRDEWMVVDGGACRAGSNDRPRSTNGLLRSALLLRPMRLG